MPSDYLPTRESDLLAWLENFLTQVTDNEEVLGVSASQVLTLQNQVNAYSTSFSDSLAATEALKGINLSKATTRSTVSSTVRTLARQFKANPNIPSTLLGALGILTNSQAGPVVTVTGLSVTGCSDGVNKLTWNRTGNSGTTMFIIESREDGENNWEFVGAVTRTSFADHDQVPGLTKWYRVISTRAGENSAPCPPVAVYGTPGTGTIQIAA